MLSKLSTVSFSGIETKDVSVEVQIASGLPNFVIVGLPDKSIAESKERIRASFSHVGLTLPPRRIIVNLAPSDLQKEGAHYDLPIALGILAALEVFDKAQLQEYVILGGLSLDALIAPVVGVLAAALMASSSQRGLICPSANSNEASWAGAHLNVLAAPDLVSLVNHFKGACELVAPTPPDVKNKLTPTYGDMRDVRGQSMLKRVFEIAAVGHHNVLMIGPPGAGKSMISQRLMGILPPLSPEEAIETTMIYSLAGMLPEEGLMVQRPFRAPHHSASLVALVGGGIHAKPGEVSLAHNGVLFLDEFPEFSRATLESLRQPLEANTITVSRANQHITYPAKIQLIAAMNPCRCGYYGVPQKECSRAPRCAADYQSKISGPLLDRFDLVVYVPQVPIDDLLPQKKGLLVESSATIQQRVLNAVNFRQQAPTLADDDLLPETQKSLRIFAEKRDLSARSCTRLLKVARSIASLDASVEVRSYHVEEAIHYRYSSPNTYSAIS
ncbi:MAG: YifB family Mg chelatase-like AAA ATPase [Holosporales bacterium]|jgi:magnesium chelatase family protein|nr:YifB family Mg chelatase-like AAA ATPase [Holosporales bacterium]